MFRVVIFLFLSFSVFAQNGTNPFMVEWKTPFGAPPFDQIKNEHFMPAFLEGMKQQKAEVEAIVNNTDVPTFSNTIEAMEKGGSLLTKVNAVFGGLLQTLSSDELQQISMEVSPLLSSHEDDINLNEKLFERIKHVYNSKPAGLSIEQKNLLEKYYKDFIRKGAGLNDKDKEKFREINEELDMLSLRFGENLLKETNSYELIIEDEADLKGLPQSALTAAKEAAKRKGYENKHLFTLHNPSYRPIIQYADNREIREKVYKAYANRGNNNNEYDNKEIISKMVSLRYKRAKLLGYNSHADFVLEVYMAKTPETVYDFLNKLNEPAVKLAEKEAEELQKMIFKEGGNFKLEPWDWAYYSEKLKKEKYDLDNEELRPYFRMENVMDGLFTVVNKLYGINITERSDIPVYHEEVKVYEVKEADGRHIGIIYTDYFPRESKRGGAWMEAYRFQSKVNCIVTPIVTNVGNLTAPTEEKPSLLTLGEVETIFHEFGHALHGLFSDVTYPTYSGYNVAWDFVELPSQLMENWAFHPEVLRIYAFHYETNEVIPEELIAKIEKVRLFNTGSQTTGGSIIPSLLDMRYHNITSDEPVDVYAVEEEIAKLTLPEIGIRYRSTTNHHIFNGEYSAGYYSYIWAEVIDADAFEAFIETSLFDQKTAASFRENILSKGGSEDPAVLYKRFRGKDPSTDALLKRRGLL
jgi:peptidyl-dipeptidase Dcp